MTKQTQIQYTVLLDKVAGTSDRGFVAGGYELRGASFYRRGLTGVADSVEAVQNAGLLQVPSYLLFNGRAQANSREPVWSGWHHALGERLTLTIDRNYNGGLKKGDKVVVYAENGGLILPRHDIIRTAVQEGTLKDGALSIGREEKDMLFGENAVYQWDGAELKQVPVKIFGSYEEFVEASNDPTFLDDMPVYAVIRSVEEAKANPAGYKRTIEQVENPELVIAAGGKAPLRRALLDENGEPRFGWDNFGSWNDGYENNDTGRAVVVGVHNCGVIGYGLLINNGRSVGVAPEALRAFLGGKSELPLESRVKQAISAKREFVHDGTLYVPVAKSAQISGIR